MLYLLILKKALLLSLIIIPCIKAQNHFRIPKQEHIVLHVFLDHVKTYNPKASKYGLDYVIECGYSGFVEAKLGIESVAKLTGGYFDVHGAIGFKMVHGREEQYNYYAGMRFAKVYRRGSYGKSFRVQLGLEGQFTIDLSDYLYCGLRITHDKRNDQEILGWTPEKKTSGFLVIGIKLKKV